MIIHFDAFYSLQVEVIVMKDEDEDEDDDDDDDDMGDNNMANPALMYQEKHCICQIILGV